MAHNLRDLNNSYNAILDWIGLGQDFQATLWIGLDWVHESMDWIGLGQQKWTHVQLWVTVLAHNKLRAK